MCEMLLALFFLVWTYWEDGDAIDAFVLIVGLGDQVSVDVFEVGDRDILLELFV